MVTPLILIAIAISFAGILPSDGEENVQRCTDFVLQRQSANCICNSISEKCACDVNGKRRTAHPCRLALALSASRRSRPRQVNAISGRQADEDLRPIDLTPRHLLLGTLDGDEEPFYHMSILPRNLDELNTRFFMYFSFSRNDSNELIYNDNSTIEKFFNFQFDKIYVIAHDQNEAGITQDALYVELKNRLLAVQLSSAVILVDWTLGAEGQTVADSFDDQAVANTIVVGREVALICYLLANRAIIRDEYFYFIGNGLGAQMLHFAAKYYTQLWRTFGFNNGNPVGLEGPEHKVGRFTALDPTAKHFQGYLSNTLVVPHVNRWDATAVDVIHTSCVRGPRSGFDEEDILRDRIGMSIPTGAVDFYPNGCSGNQPNCVGVMPRRLRTKCSHQMALYFFIASISTDPTVEHYMNAYATTEWDNRKSVAERGGERNLMGFKARSDDKLKLGIFSLPLVINLDSYSINEPRTDTIMFKVDTASLRVERVFHPKFRLPDIDSGQLIDDFPPQKPTLITNLDENEIRSCGQFRPPVPSARVVEGHLPFVNQFPWVVCLIVLAVDDDGRPRAWEQSCTGSLISSRFALFAAHCFQLPLVEGESEDTYSGLAPANWVYYVTFGTNDCMQPSGNYRKLFFNSDFVFISPGYTPGVALALWDISLVKFHEPIELPETYNGGSVNTICWRSGGQFDYGDSATELYIAGFGTKSFDVTVDNERLTWIAYRTVQPDFSSYQGGYFHSLVHSIWSGAFYMKTIDRNTLRTIASGDSGAPIVRYVRTASEPEVEPSPNVSVYRGVLVGTVSTGVTDFNNPEVDMDGRIAVPVGGIKVEGPVYDWILQTMEDNDFDLDEEPEEHLNVQGLLPPTFVV